jgi:hypothetical protein
MTDQPLIPDSNLNKTLDGKDLLLALRANDANSLVLQKLLRQAIVIETDPKNTPSAATISARLTAFIKKQRKDKCTDDDVKQQIDELGKEQHWSEAQKQQTTHDVLLVKHFTDSYHDIFPKGVAIAPEDVHAIYNYALAIKAPTIAKKTGFHSV